MVSFIFSIKILHLIVNALLTFSVTCFATYVSTINWVITSLILNRVCPATEFRNCCLCVPYLLDSKRNFLSHTSKHLQSYVGYRGLPDFSIFVGIMPMHIHSNSLVHVLKNSEKWFRVSICWNTFLVMYDWGLRKFILGAILCRRKWTNKLKEFFVSMIMT